MLMPKVRIIEQYHGGITPYRCGVEDCGKPANFAVAFDEDTTRRILLRPSIYQYCKTHYAMVMFSIEFRMHVPWPPIQTGKRI